MNNLVSNLDILNIYKNYDYRLRLLCSTADETYAGRIMWSIASRNRRFAIDLTKDVKLKPIKDHTYEFLKEVYEEVLQNAVKESKALNIRMSEEEFLDGYQCKAWNENAKYQTVFDILTEAIERWHVYYLGVGLIFEKDEWLETTSEKLKWPKRRFGTLTQQPFERSYYVRKHYPFKTNSMSESFFEDAGVLSMFNREVPGIVKAM